MTKLIKSVGRYSYGIDVATIKNFGCIDCFVEVGSFTSIGNGLTIFLVSGKGHEHHTGTNYPFGILYPDIFDNYGHAPVFQSKGNVVIGNDVWIGENVVILPGVTIGDGAVVGANAVVSKDCPPYSITVGNPGQTKGYRYKPEIVERMKKLEWWSYPDYVINKILPELRKPMTEEVLFDIENTLDLFNSMEKEVWL